MSCFFTRYSYYKSIAAVLQRFYSIIAVVLQYYCIVIAVVLHHCCSGTAGVLQQRCKYDAVAHKYIPLKTAAAILSRTHVILLSLIHLYIFLIGNILFEKR